MHCSQFPIICYSHSNNCWCDYDLWFCSYSTVKFVIFLKSSLLFNSLKLKILPKKFVEFKSLPNLPSNNLIFCNNFITSLLFGMLYSFYILCNLKGFHGKKLLQNKFITRAGSRHTLLYLIRRNFWQDKNSNNF